MLWDMSHCSYAYSSKAVEVQTHKLAKKPEQRMTKDKKVDEEEKHTTRPARDTDDSTANRAGSWARINPGLHCNPLLQTLSQPHCPHQNRARVGPLVTELYASSPRPFIGPMTADSLM
jgi:hypothetical protein